MVPSVPTCLDVRGVCCPLPLIHLAKAAKLLAPGETIEIMGNDPIFETTVRDYCRENGHDVLEVKPAGSGGVSILIRVGG